MTTYPTQNDLSAAVRERVAVLCNTALADTIDLASQLKVAHWNVRGPTFLALHRLFDEVHGDVAELVDEIAERAVQLGGVAAGTVRIAANASRLAEYPFTAASSDEHLRAVTAALAACARTSRAAIDECDRAGDKVTADLFTETAAALDKSLWLVEAHLRAGG